MKVSVGEERLVIRRLTMVQLQRAWEDILHIDMTLQSAQGFHTYS